MTKINLILNIFTMKNLSNLGKALSKTEQKQVFGGGPIIHFIDDCTNASEQICTLDTNGGCPPGEVCTILIAQGSFKNVTWDSRKNRCLCPNS
jgi:hypothetical protein